MHLPFGFQYSRIAAPARAPEARRNRTHTHARSLRDNAISCILYAFVRRGLLTYLEPGTFKLCAFLSTSHHLIPLRHFLHLHRSCFSRSSLSRSTFQFFPFLPRSSFFFTHVRIEESHFVCCDRRVSNLPSSYFAVTLFSYWTIQQFRPRNIYTKYPLNNARFFYIKRYIETVSFLFKCALRPILSKIRKKIPRSFRHKNTLVHRGRRNFLTAVKWSL